jgi:isochorismate pyruvate lyase
MPGGDALARAPVDCRGMGEVRAAIDELDDRLIDLLALRVRYVEQAAALKPALGITANAPDRVLLVLERVQARASAKAMPTDLAEDLWCTLIDWSIAHEARLMAQDPKAPGSGA